MILRLYKSLVQPVMGYGNIICDPYYVMDQRAIGKLQHRATKIIRHYSYQELLQKLSLPSLAYR